MMKIAIASDHTGIEYKRSITAHLTKKGIEVIDFGLSAPDPAADYPDFALPASEAVSSGDCDMGILICGTGVGMSLCANKVRGIRCALCSNEFMATATRQHNDSNMLAIGARVLELGEAIAIVDAFIGTPFSGEERHVRRLSKLSAIESKYFKDSIL